MQAGADADDRRGRLVRDALLAIFALSGVVYLTWRTTAFNVEAPIFSTIFWIAEVLALLAALIRLFVTRRADLAPPQPPPPPTPWPAIDVFITTYHEPAAVVRRTLAACTAMRGAHETWLLDDGARPEMAALAAEFGARYVARAENRDAKAGNLNHGLAHARGELLAVFDADHAPEPRFLERLAGYFADPRTALVQTPQDYFNTDSFQHGRPRGARSLWHEQSVFHWTEQPGRAALDAVTCCGCSMMLRRAAVDDIGGFPGETVTEDMHASVRLHKAGWTTRYHAEPLAYGVAPAGPREFLRQRLRWGEGNMQVSRVEGLPFARELSFGQNLSYLMLGTTYLEAWVKLVAYVSPVVFLFTFVPPIWSDMAVFFAFFLPYLASGLLAHVEFGRGYAPLLLMERFAMARLTAGLGATAGFFRRRIAFRVTTKTTGGDGGLILLAPQAAVLTGGLAGIGYAAFRLVDINQPPPPFGITTAVAALAAYNCVLAAWVLTDAVRAATLPDEAWSCPEPIPLRLAGETKIRSARGLSADALDLDWEGAPPTGPVAVTLFLPGGPMPLEALPEPRAGRRLRLRFAWSGLPARDALEAQLLVGRWRRVLGGRWERRATWLERIGLLTDPWAVDRRPWTWGVWRSAGREGLACRRGAQALLFGAPPPGDLDFETPGEIVRLTPLGAGPAVPALLPAVAAGATLVRLP